MNRLAFALAVVFSTGCWQQPPALTPDPTAPAPMPVAKTQSQEVSDYKQVSCADMKAMKAARMETAQGTAKRWEELKARDAKDRELMRKYSDLGVELCIVNGYSVPFETNAQNNLTCPGIMAYEKAPNPARDKAFKFADECQPGDMFTTTIPSEEKRRSALTPGRIKRR